MKKIAIIGCFLTVIVAFGQGNYRESLEGIKKVKINSAPKVIIKAHLGNELLIPEGSLKKPGNTKGLKSVFSGIEDNTDLGLRIEREGNVLSILNLRDMRGPDLLIYLPETMDISIRGQDNCDVQIEGFNGEIEARTNQGTIEIEDVTGPIVANSNSGDIRVIFDELNQASPISIISSAGNIDVSLPSHTPARLKLRANAGDIYTDFNLKFSSETISRRQTLSAEINNGGVHINLLASSGNIYLRKK
ncbi:DUF4097 family beta strand repeat protein [Leptobacterium flavescens]|uniref:DUF4097 family beta strand repeat protein n=1 Tax=Leptobacterium flavescens TaxID=472055 RepID=A0A6P0UU70_9FLAO|nr:DUF4097 family beta strand repeat-containing protein [Leptobacterium flavescens]NER14363.1 DUF4097 family beta strand repeat protein [Leptobacterium flavescens]